MSVYVDPIRPCLPNKRWPYSKAAHLVADSVGQLHDFAARLGLRRAWFQNRPGLPHYDVTEGKRWQAIRLGAMAITHKELVKIMKSNRKGHYGRQFIIEGQRRDHPTPGP